MCILSRDWLLVSQESPGIKAEGRSENKFFCHFSSNALWFRFSLCVIQTSELTLNIVTDRKPVYFYILMIISSLVCSTQMTLLLYFYVFNLVSGILLYTNNLRELKIVNSKLEEFCSENL